VDRASESRALAVQPRTLEVLAGLGASDTHGDSGNDGVSVSQEMVGCGNRAMRVQIHVGAQRRPRVVSVPCSTSARPTLGGVALPWRRLGGVGDPGIVDQKITGPAASSMAATAATTRSGR
jgi:hypothetical protein